MIPYDTNQPHASFVSVDNDTIVIIIFHPRCILRRSLDSDGMGGRQKQQSIHAFSISILALSCTELFHPEMTVETSRNNNSPQWPPRPEGCGRDIRMPLGCMMLDSKREDLILLFPHSCTHYSAIQCLSLLLSHYHTIIHSSTHIALSPRVARGRGMGVHQWLINGSQWLINGAVNCVTLEQYYESMILSYYHTIPSPPLPLSLHNAS